MKVFYIVLILFLLFLLTLSEKIDIVNAITNDSFNEKVFSRFNPINGTDYWKSREICCDDYVLWSCELKNEIMIMAIEVEFDMPPSNLIIFGEGEGRISIPISTVDYSEKIRQHSDSKNIFASSKIDLNFTFPIKKITLKMENRFKIKYNVLLARINLFQNSRSYLISTIHYTNTGFNQYCFKVLENPINPKVFLTYEDCYYCLMYDLVKCLFTYELSNSIDIKFSPIINPIKKFFILNNYENYLEKGYDEFKLAPQDKNSIKSFTQEEIEYKSEIRQISSNSTLSPDYNVFYVFDLLDNYWSSAMSKDHPCPIVEIKISLLETIVIKQIDIKWIRLPNKFNIKICINEKECQYSKLFNNLNEKDLNFYLQDLFVKGKEVIIHMYPNEEYKNFCLVQISSLKIFRNQIFVKMLNVPVDKQITKSFYYLYPLKNKQAEKDSKVIKDLIELSNSISNNITKTFNTIEHHVKKRTIKIFNKMRSLVNKRIILDSKISNMTGYLNEFAKKIARRVNSTNTNQEDDYLLLNDLYNFYQNPISSISFKTYKDSNKKLVDEFSDYEKYLSANSYRFKKIHIDKYHLDLKNKIDLLNRTNQYVDKLIVYNKEKIYVDILKSTDKRMNSFSEKNLLQNFKELKNNLKKELMSKLKDMKNLSNKFQLFLQSIRLIKFENQPIYLKTDTSLKSCKPFKIIKNAFFSNLVFRFLVKFKPETTKNEEIIIIKFINKKFFMYLKVDFETIEFWKVKYGTKFKIFQYSHKTDRDKDSSLASYSKILYFFIQINSKRITINLKIAYEDVPKNIVEYLNNLKFEKIDDIFNILNIKDNYFDTFFKPNSQILKDYFDFDLQFLGYIGLYHSNVNNLNFVFINLSGVPLKKDKVKKSKKKIISLSTKEKFRAIDRLGNLRIVPIFGFLKSVLKINDPQILQYSLDFEIIKEFYLKFILDMSILSEDLSIIFVSKLKKETYVIEIKNLLTHTLVMMNSYYYGKRKALNRIKLRNISSSLKFPVIFTRIFDTLKINIDTQENKNNSQFLTIKDFYFFKIYFVVNKYFEKAISDIFISDSSVLKLKQKKKAEKSKCSLIRFLSYNCKFNSKRVCRIKFCQNCCGKKIMKINKKKFKVCFIDCVNKKTRRKKEKLGEEKD